MTPAARIAAAIGILDNILQGTPAEKALTNWARGSRFAGSGDRAAIRDHVFDALRCRRSYGWLGGADTGRGLMIGAVRSSGADPEDFFTGAKYAPTPLMSYERAFRDLRDSPAPVRLDVPDWLWNEIEQSLDSDRNGVLTRMQSRAPVFLRANLAKGSREAAALELMRDGIETEPNRLSSAALRVTANARRIGMSAAYLNGHVEFQDASSQAAVDALPIADGKRVLDYCAGGGGKALAIAARWRCTVVAHDADAQRMRDIPARALRAGANIEIAKASDLNARSSFDLVLCDVPCSGSGAWRRMPDAKWRLTSEMLGELADAQLRILEAAMEFTASDGTLAYMTCSLLDRENRGSIEAFLERNPDWRLAKSRCLTLLEGGDGFFFAHLVRRNAATGVLKGSNNPAQAASKA